MTHPSPLGTGRIGIWVEAPLSADVHLNWTSAHIRM